MRVLLLAGGESGEREVSLATGRAIGEALKRLGHQLRALDPATGHELTGPDGAFLIDENTKAEQVSVPIAPLMSQLSTGGVSDVDLVFLALHGGYGENGSIQNLLELSGIPFTGSSMTASAIAMNKAITKRLMSSVGVRTPEWHMYHCSGDARRRAVAEEIVRDGYLPIIIKPNASGSTLGLTCVHEAEQIPRAVEQAAVEDHDILVERYIVGRELTVAVLDAHAFPVVEIIPGSGLYDYEAKYTKGKTEYVAPAQIPSEIDHELREMALKVYGVIGASGLARVDFILADSGEPYCLELNSLPGMTELSLAPMAAACEGVEFDRLVQMMIDSAVRKNKQRP